MEKNTKKIIIINGVMGVIGSPIFSYFAERGEDIVYGVSRRGSYFDEYVNTKSGKLPEANLVFSLTDYKKDNYELDIDNFIDTLPNLPIVFIHTMGEYVTEMTRDGELNIVNDHDGDGINDNVKRLTYDVPLEFCQRLKKLKKPVTFVQIGSLSDKYRIDIHGSWFRSMDFLKEDLTSICKKHKNFTALILNVSSVLTPKELIDRPFVSLKTNADMRYWLPPEEIAGFINSFSKMENKGFHEEELYRKWPNISKDHFRLDTYKIRRGNELYDSLAHVHGDILRMAEGDSVDYKFNNPFHMDRLWGDLTILLSRQHRKEQPVIFYNPHPWFFIVRNKTEHEIFSSIQENGGIVLQVCGSNTYLDKAILTNEFKGYRHRFVLSKRAPYKNNYNLNIYGDFIIEAHFDQKSSNKIDEFFSRYKKITSDNIKELKAIVSKEGKNKLVISRDKNRAVELRKKLANNFTIPRFFKV